MPMPAHFPAPTQVFLVENNPGDTNLVQKMLAEVESADFHCEFADRLSAGPEHVSSATVDVVLHAHAGRDLSIRLVELFHCDKDVEVLR